jgi:hypothetical protein
VSRDTDQGSPISRILGGIGQAVRAAATVRENAAANRCVNYQQCGNHVPARSWISGEQSRKQLLCDECAEKAGNAAATVLGKFVQNASSGILGSMFAGREKRR